MKHAVVVSALLFIAAAPAAEYVIDCAGGAVAVPAALAVGDTVRVALADGSAFALTLVAAPPAGIAGPSFLAREASGGASGVVRLTATGLRVTLDDFARSRAYTIRVRDGAATVDVRDVSGGPPEECGTCRGGLSDCLISDCLIDAKDDAATNQTIKQSKIKQSLPLLASSDAFVEEEHNPVIDILVVFDQGAKKYVFDKTARTYANAAEYDSLEDCAEAAVARMNEVLEHSQLLDKFSYRLVGAMEVDTAYTEVSGASLGAIRAGTGAFARVPAMQKATGADTTVLLVNRTGGTSSGLSYSLEKSIAAEKVAAMASGNLNYSVCDINTVFYRYTMSHEVGHQMGAGHSNYNLTNSYAGAQTTAYSLGYHFDAGGTRYHTVMAYNYATYKGAYHSDFKSIPYFSSPDITPEDIGVPVGTESNDNRRVLLQTYTGASNWREHTVLYDWEVRFLDDDGEDIADGAYFTYPGYVTITNSNPNATIYYTKSSATPNKESQFCENGHRFMIYETTTFTATAVTNGVAISTRSITMHEGLAWSGESGKNGNGEWSDSSSVLSWNNATKAFEAKEDAAFPDLDGVSEAVVTVKGGVAPYSADFAATTTAYTFNKGDDNALITLPGDTFLPKGDVTFNVPLKTATTEITNPANHTLTFAAPFGPNVAAGATSGSYAGKITAGGNNAVIRIAPGKGRTQTLAQANAAYTYSDSTMQFGPGTVTFTGKGGDDGLFQNTMLEVLDGGNLVFQGATETGLKMSKKHLTVRKGGAITFLGLDQFARILDLEGATVTFSASESYGRAFEFYGGPTINVSADSSFAATKKPTAYLRGASPSFVLSNGATLTNCLVFLQAPTSTGGISVTGNGTFQQNSYEGATLTYSGATTIGSGVTFELNATHSNAGAYTVAGGARLTGRGAVTGAGVVSLAGGAVMDGSLVVNNLSCADGARFGEATHSVAATVTGSLAATDGAAVAVTNGCLIVGAGCDGSGFSSANLTIHNAGLVLSNDLTVASLLCKNATLTLSGGASLTITGTRGIDYPALLTIRVENPTAGDRIPLITAASAGFANWKAINVEGMPYGYELACDGTSLYCRKITDTYAIPGLGVAIAYDATLGAWLSADATYQERLETDYWYDWQDYMDEEGANGYPNWMNYVLGLSATDGAAKVRATIAVKDGAVTVSVADSIPNAPTIPAVRIVCTLYEKAELGGKWDDGTVMDGKAAIRTVAADAKGGFYYVEVSVEAAD